jgi:hypothetical protein
MGMSVFLARGAAAKSNSRSFVDVQVTHIGRQRSNAGICGHAACICAMWWRTELLLTGILVSLMRLCRGWWIGAHSAGIVSTAII